MAELFEVGQLKDFSPTPGLLKKITGVRVAKPSTSIEHPGLLSISDYPSDTKKAIIGLLCEFWGLALLFYYAVVIRRLPWYWILIGAIVLFLLDLGLMRAHHFYAVAANKLLHFENAMYKASSVDLEKATHKANHDKIKKNERKAVIFEFLLWIAAFLKIGGVLYLVPIGRNGELPYAPAVALLLAYGGAAFFHIKNTGYAWAGYAATKEFNIELSRFAVKHEQAAGAIPRNDSLPLLTDSDIFGKAEVQSLEPGSHRISENPYFGTNGQSKYQLERLGILTDKQIATWEAKTNDRNGVGAELSRVAMRLQHNMFTGVPR